MIYLDYNHIFLSTYFSNKDSVDLDLLRHSILNCLRSYKKQFSEKYGDLVLCADCAGNYWRKALYVHYKANRKKNRDKSGLNWQPIYDSLNVIRQEIKDNLPYRVIVVPTVEADDIIAVLCKKFQSEKHLILSRDLDFIQLQKYTNIEQYSITDHRFLRTDDATLYLKEKLLRGDAGDGIPNFLSDDDSFVNPDKRQKPLREAKLQEHIRKPIENYPDQLKQNYYRNQKLIDFEAIPDSIEKKIITEFESQNPTRKNLYKYFIDKGLKNLMSSIGEF